MSCALRSAPEVFPALRPFLLRAIREQLGTRESSETRFSPAFRPIPPSEKSPDPGASGLKRQACWHRFPE